MSEGKKGTVKMLGGKKGTVKILKESNFNHKKSNNLVHIFLYTRYIEIFTTLRR